MPAPPPCAENETPPHTHTEKMAGPHVERKDCPHRKNTTIVETPPPSHMGFFIHAPPPGERLHPPCMRRS